MVKINIEDVIVDVQTETIVLPCNISGSKIIHIIDDMYGAQIGEYVDNGNTITIYEYLRVVDDVIINVGLCGYDRWHRCVVWKSVIGYIDDKGQYKPVDKE